jgi:hypothetical protein
MLPLLFFTSYNNNTAIVTALTTATALLYKPRPPFLLLPLSFFSLTYLLSLLSRLLKTLHYYIQFLITFRRHYHNASPTHHFPRLHHGMGWSHRHITIPHYQHRRLRHAAPLAVHAALGFYSGHGIVRGDSAPARGCLHVRRNGIPAGSGERERRSNFAPRSRTPKPNSLAPKHSENWVKRKSPPSTHASSNPERHQTASNIRT